VWKVEDMMTDDTIANDDRRYNSQWW
jgi:hypothetical protein